MIWMFSNHFLAMKNEFDVIGNLVHQQSFARWLFLNARHSNGGFLGDGG